MLLKSYFIPFGILMKCITNMWSLHRIYCSNVDYMKINCLESNYNHQIVIIVVSITFISDIIKVTYFVFHYLENVYLYMCQFIFHYLMYIMHILYKLVDPFIMKHIISNHRICVNIIFITLLWINISHVI